MGLDVSRKPTKCPNLCFPADYVKDVWECTSHRSQAPNSMLFFASHGNQGELLLTGTCHLSTVS